MWEDKSETLLGDNDGCDKKNQMIDLMYIIKYALLSTLIYCQPYSFNI